MIKKLFPTKSSTIYPHFPYKNTGMDPIIEIIPSDVGSSRFLLDFSENEIKSIINNHISGSLWKAELDLYVVNIDNFNKDDLIINAFPVSGSWDRGTGYFGDIPINTSGVSWVNSKVDNPWNSEGGDYINNVYSSYQCKNNNVRFNFDITNLIEYQLNQELYEGFIFKLDELQEVYNETSFKFYSKNSNEVFIPKISFKWDDSEYIEYDNLLTDSDFIMSMNHKEIYSIKSVPNFEVFVSERYPEKIYTSEILYKFKHLPEESYYAIEDVINQEFIIQFDEDYTKISTRDNKSFFKLHMDNFYLERPYRFLIKTIINGEVIIWKSPTTFKVREII